MSASYCKVILLGNCTRDPDIKYTAKGTPLATIGLAINRTWKDEDGQKKEETTFVDVTLWGRLAELAEKHLCKGQPVFIEGRLQLDSWEDKQTGQRRSKLRVVGESLQMLGTRAGNGQGANPKPAAEPAKAPGNQTKPAAAAGSSARNQSSKPEVDENGDPQEIPF